MEVYGDEYLSRTQDFEWYKRFKAGRGEIEDDLHPGQPWTSKTDANTEISVKLLKRIIAWAFEQLLN
jgi:hypothetical protein